MPRLRSQWGTRDSAWKGVENCGARGGAGSKEEEAQDRALDVDIPWEEQGPQGEDGTIVGASERWGATGH